MLTDIPIVLFSVKCHFSVEESPLSAQSRLRGDVRGGEESSLTSPSQEVGLPGHRGQSRGVQLAQENIRTDRRTISRRGTGLLTSRGLGQALGEKVSQSVSQ